MMHKTGEAMVRRPNGRTQHENGMKKCGGTETGRRKLKRKKSIHASSVLHFPPARD
jgi:hypothetical protein